MVEKVVCRVVEKVVCRAVEVDELAEELTGEVGSCVNSDERRECVVGSDAEGQGANALAKPDRVVAGVRYLDSSI